MLTVASPHTTWVYANELSVGEPLSKFKMGMAAITTHNMMTPGTLAPPSLPLVMCQGPMIQPITDSIKCLENKVQGSFLFSKHAAIASKTHTLT